MRAHGDGGSRRRIHGSGRGGWLRGVVAAAALFTLLLLGFGVPGVLRNGAALTAAPIIDRQALRSGPPPPRARTVFSPPVWFGAPPLLMPAAETPGRSLVSAMVAMCSPSSRAAENTSAYFSSVQHVFVRHSRGGVDGVEERQQFRFDAVITHVDPAVDGWMARAQADAKANGRLLEGARFRDNGEVVFAVRSLLMYARAFLRDVVLVVETAAHVKNSVLAHVEAEAGAAGIRLRVVTHRDLGLGTNATYNSNAIEAAMHRAPGLSDWFLYLNNDMVLGRPLGLWDLFRPSVAKRRERVGASADAVHPEGSEVRTIPVGRIAAMLTASAQRGNEGGRSFDDCVGVWRDWLAAASGPNDVVAFPVLSSGPAEAEAILLEPLAFAEKVPIQMLQRRAGSSGGGGGATEGFELLSAFPLRLQRQQGEHASTSEPSGERPTATPGSSPRRLRGKVPRTVAPCEHQRALDPFALRLPNQPPISVNATGFATVAAALFKATLDSNSGDVAGQGGPSFAVAMARIALVVPSACDFRSRHDHRLALSFRLALWRRLRMAASTRTVPSNATAFIVAAIGDATLAVSRSVEAPKAAAFDLHPRGRVGDAAGEIGVAALPFTDGDRFPDFVKHNERAVLEALGVAVTHTFAHAPRLFNRGVLQSLLDRGASSSPLVAAAARATRRRPFRHYRDVWVPFLHDAAVVANAHALSRALHHGIDSFPTCPAAVLRAVGASRLAPGKRSEGASEPAAVNYVAEKMWPFCDRQHSNGPNSNGAGAPNDTRRTEVATVNSSQPPPRSDQWAFALDRKPLYFFAMAGDRRQLQQFMAELRIQESLFVTVNDNFRGSGELPSSAVDGVRALLRAAVGLPDDV